MKSWIFIISLLFLNKVFGQTTQNLRDKYVLVIHGGAGTISKSQMTPEREKAYMTGLDAALKAGNDILKNGGSALDAVEAAVRTMEDNPLFNAGKGAVFTNEGRNELDAAIMNGKTLGAGSVAGVTTIKNPISAARAVMEKSPHVMMAGPGAEKFAKGQGLEIVDPSYFHTEDRWRGLQRARTTDSLQQLKLKELRQSMLQMDELMRKTDSAVNAVKGNSDSLLKRIEQLKKEILNGTTAHGEFSHEVTGVTGKYGTVGAVALDRHGNLAAATSTGGMNNKKFGRIGDAPIIGAGTYANNNTAAISGTGWGEYYIRLVLAKTISDMMEFGKIKLKDAADELVMKRLPAMGGDGGLVAVDKDGNIAMPFCTSGMYRGFIKNDGTKEIRIYKE
jgi:beta-aspartyl-peptidase (threonine type)